MAIPLLIAAAAIAAAGAAAGAGIKASKEQEIQGTWNDILDKYSKLGEFSPQYAFGREYEVNPSLYQIPDDIKYQLINMPAEDKQRLLNAFRETKDMSESGIASRTDLERARAAIDSAQESSATQQAIINDLGGRGAPGLEALIRGQSAQGSAQRNMLAGLTAAAQAGQERLGAQQLYGNQLQGLYDRDMDQASRNASIVNQFNQTNAERKRQINERNIDLMNSYQQINNQSRMMQDQINRANARQKYEDRINRVRDAERVTGYKTGSIRNEGEAIAGGVQQSANAIGGALAGGYGGGGGSAFANMGGGSGGGFSASPNYYYTGYGNDIQNQINKIGQYR